MINNTCCIFGHRRINETEALNRQLRETVERLITEEGIDTFLFGSKSHFNDLCYETVTECKQRYPHIRRVYVRAEFPFIDEHYKRYLLERYEDTYFPESIHGAGKAVYIERNCEMIYNSRFCIVYYDVKMLPLSRKSGTEKALAYARRQGKDIILFP